MVGFGPFFDQIFAGFQRKNDAQTNMVLKEDVGSKAWSLANDSDKCVKQLEEALRQEDGVVALWIPKFSIGGMRLKR